MCPICKVHIFIFALKDEAVGCFNVNVNLILINLNEKGVLHYGF